jgi:hypothetical protein
MSSGVPCGLREGSEGGLHEMLRSCLPVE